MIPKIQTQARKGVQGLREQSFQVNGPQLFNCLPATVRNMTKCTVEEFKAKLDTFLEKVPDEPSMRGLVPAACTADARPSNSILDQVRRIQLARWPEDQMAREDRSRRPGWTDSYVVWVGQRTGREDQDDDDASGPGTGSPNHYHNHWILYPLQNTWKRPDTEFVNICNYVQNSFIC